MIMAAKRGPKSTRRKLSPEAEAQLRKLEVEQSRHEQMRERNLGRPCYRCGSPTKGFGDHYDETNDRMICWGCQMRDVHERYLKEAVEKISLCPEDLGELASAKQRGFLILPRSRPLVRDRMRSERFLDPLGRVLVSDDLRDAVTSEQVRGLRDHARGVPAGRMLYSTLR
jgi:hypothetical protein